MVGKGVSFGREIVLKENTSLSPTLFVATLINTRSQRRGVNKDNNKQSPPGDGE